MTLGGTRSVKLGRGKWAIRSAATLSKLEGPVSWSGVLLPFSRKKIRKVYPVWRSPLPPNRPPPKSYIKSWGPSNFLRAFASPRPPVVASMGTMCGPDDGVAEGGLGQSTDCGLVVVNVRIKFAILLR